MYALPSLLEQQHWRSPTPANGTSGEDGLSFPGSLVGESQLRIPKIETNTTFSNRVPLVSVELEYHAEWCALKSPSIRVSVVIIR